MSTIFEMIEQTSIRFDKQLEKAVAPLMQKLGLNYFGYQSVTDDKQWFCLANQPNWLQYSASEQFYHHDPSLVDPWQYQSGIAFPANHQDQQFQQTLVQEAENVFDIHYPIAIIKRFSNRTDYFFFAASQKHNQCYQQYFLYKELLVNTFPEYFYQQARPIIEHAYQNSVKLDSLLLTNDKLMDVSLVQPVNFLTHLQRENYHLTPRELQCLQLYQQGLTAKESAKKLDISYRTIEEHFENIKHKCNVQFKRQLLTIDKDK